MQSPVSRASNSCRCRLCGSTNISHILVVDSINILKCGDCGFIFPASLSSDQELQDHYDKGYEDERFVRGQRVNSLINFRILTKRLRDLEGLRILDVGGGYGFLAKMLNSLQDTSCEIVEISSRQRQYAKDVLGLIVYADLQQIRKKYDLIVSFEVLEHIPDPISFMGALAGLLEPGGSLVLGTDNFNSPTVRRMGDLFPKWVPHEHISCFSPSSIQFLFKSVPSLSRPEVYTYLVWELQLASLAKLIKRVLKWNEGRTYPDNASPTQRRYKYYNVRRILSPLIAAFSLSHRLNGEMLILHSRLVNKAVIGD